MQVDYTNFELENNSVFNNLLVTDKPSRFYKKKKVGQVRSSRSVMGSDDNEKEKKDTSAP